MIDLIKLMLTIGFNIENWSEKLIKFVNLAMNIGYIFIILIICSLTCNGSDENNCLTCN